MDKTDNLQIKIQSFPVSGAEILFRRDNDYFSTVIFNSFQQKMPFKKNQRPATSPGGFPKPGTFPKEMIWKNELSEASLFLTSARF